MTRLEFLKNCKAYWFWWAFQSYWKLLVIFFVYSSPSELLHCSKLSSTIPKWFTWSYNTCNLVPFFYLHSKAPVSWLKHSLYHISKFITKMSILSYLSLRYSITQTLTHNWLKPKNVFEVRLFVIWTTSNEETIILFNNYNWTSNIGQVYYWSAYVTEETLSTETNGAEAVSDSQNVEEKLILKIKLYKIKRKYM